MHCGFCSRYSSSLHVVSSGILDVVQYRKIRVKSIEYITLKLMEKCTQRILHSVVQNISV